MSTEMLSSERIAELQEESRRRAEVAPVAPVQLPIWPEPERAEPNVLLRSALFGCARTHRAMEDEELASWGSSRITFTGISLNQFDETAWLQLVHMFRVEGEPSDGIVRFNAKAFLRAIGKSGGGGRDVKSIIRTMQRLAGCAITVAHDGEGYVGGLLFECRFDEHRGHFAAQLNPKMLRLFESGHTRLSWGDRKALPTGLATWLQRYVLSHRATKSHPHRIGLEKLLPLTGMTSSPKEFKRHLKRVMPKLEGLGVVAFWEIAPGNVLEFVR